MYYYRHVIVEYYQLNTIPVYILKVTLCSKLLVVLISTYWAYSVLLFIRKTRYNYVRFEKYVFCCTMLSDRGENLHFTSNSVSCEPQNTSPSTINSMAA